MLRIRLNSTEAYDVFGKQGVMIVYTPINENIKSKVFDKILHFVSEQKQRKVVSCRKTINSKINLYLEAIVRLISF